jgi:hypothetical protein
MMMMDKLVKWTVLAGETEVLGEYLPRRHFVHHKSHLLDPGLNPGRRGGKPATNRFSYGFIDHLQVVTPNNYDTLANFHTTNHSEFSQSLSTSLYLVTALHNDYSSAVPSLGIFW